MLRASGVGMPAASSDPPPGKRCFAFAKLGAGEIAGLKARVSSSLLGKTEN